MAIVVTASTYVEKHCCSTIERASCVIDANYVSQHCAVANQAVADRS